ncbi:hypothetical protein E2C01_068379 [Portunus trituberculatus]|uniref:Uncharacterized protein n=1 Tax=Portunus trituberculatus TaxID=210409 RepID=A0A5B7HZW3_PORTR|nr:hypothetical protein [Portunus trituberculatus]
MLRCNGLVSLPPRPAVPTTGAREVTRRQARHREPPPPLGYVTPGPRTAPAPPHRTDSAIPPRRRPRDPPPGPTLCHALLGLASMV